MFPLEEIVQALLLALVIDRFFGDPSWLYRYLPHPVELIGRVLSDFERRSFHRAKTDRAQFQYGGVITLITVLTCFALGILIQWLCLMLPFGWCSSAC